jgi:hypothetical protein
MPIRPEQLLVLVDGLPGSTLSPAPLPSPSDALYCVPNADGTRKLCGNCGLWAEMDSRCLLFGIEKEVTREQVCGYHVYGEPVLYGTTLGGQKMVEPELAGLITAPDGGTSCDRCVFYDPRTNDAGVCRGVSQDGEPANVQALGCCARWLPRS